MKEFVAGTGIKLKEIDGKTFICLDRETTLELKEGNFILRGDSLIIQSGPGVKISSVHPNVLVISADLTKQDEKIFDLKQEVNKRLETIEAIFLKIVKANK